MVKHSLKLRDHKQEKALCVETRTCLMVREETPCNSVRRKDSLRALTRHVSVPSPLAGVDLWLCSEAAARRLSGNVH